MVLMAVDAQPLPFTFPQLSVDMESRKVPDFEPGRDSSLRSELSFVAGPN